MSNVNVSRLGANNGGTDKKELFLKVFAGEVLTAFEENVVTKGRTMERQIANGKSASFPVMGRAAAAYHTPGNEIDATPIAHAEKVITIDELLVSAVSIASIDEAMNHYDVRSHYSSEVGRVLADQWDRHVLQQGVLAARTTTPVLSGFPGGGSLQESTAGDFDDPNKLLAALFDARTMFGEKNVPMADLTFYTTFDRYHKLMQSNVIHRDFGGTGSLASATVGPIAGLTVIPTNRLPSATVSNGSVAAGTGNKYAGDFSNVKGLILHKSAVGTVKLLDIAVESEWLIRNQAWFTVSKYAVGHGVLREEGAIELIAA